MSHYDAFTSDTQELLSQIYVTYIEFYKIKQSFVKKREEFLKVLGSIEKKETLQAIVDDEKEKEEKKGENLVQVEQYSKSSPIFHKIALATHPDKNPECNPVYFQEAQKANEKGKIGKLVFLSQYLRIDISTSFTQEEIIQLKEAIEKKKRKIEHYQKTYPWIYANADTEELRKKIVEAFLKVNVS